jgi:hypothetical protein
MRRTAIVLAALAALGMNVGEAFAQRGDRKAKQTAASGPSEADRAKGRADAPGALAAAGVKCSVSDAAWLGTSVEGKGKDAVTSNMYEVVCQEGLGFIVSVSPTRTQAFDCLAMKAGAKYDDQGRLQSGLVCTLPGNADQKPGLQRLAAQAGARCTLTDGVWLGYNADTGLNRYEIACQEGGGFILDRKPGDQVSTLDCFTVRGTSAACKLTPDEQQFASLQPILAKAGKSCSISNARAMGQTSTGATFYELACGEGPGVVLEARKDGAVRALDCVEAANIGGGCTLTDTSAALAQRTQAVVAALAPLGVTCADPEMRVIGRESGGAGRQVTELKCSDRPQGLIAIVPVEGGAGTADYEDCISVGRLGQQCQLTPKAQIFPLLTAAMTAHNRNCDVTDFKPLGLGETADSTWVELACSGGQSWVVDLPKSRARPTRALTCEGWRERGGGRCELPANAGK